MAKDYGRRQNKSTANMPRQLLLILASFLLGYLCATVFDANSVSHFLTKIVTQASSPEVANNAVKPKELPKPKFEFYTLLSKDNAPRLSAAPTGNKSTQPPLEVAKALPIPAKIEGVPPGRNNSKQTYLIQAAAFNQRSDAEKLKASLVLHGFDVTISTTIQNNVTWHRILIGPFVSQTAAEQAQLDLLHNNHIKGIVRKIDG